MSETETTLEATQQTSPAEQVEQTQDAPVFVPRTDIYETTDSICVVSEMPGVDEQSVDITLEKNILTLRGRPSVPAATGRLRVAEYELGSYERSFTLSEHVDRDGIEANMKDGVLRLRLPKAKEAMIRKIPVKST